MSDNKINILYLDDEEHNLNSMKATFRYHYNVHCATTTEEAIKLLRSEKIGIIITDQKMPDITGTQFLDSIKEEYPDIIKILLTGYTDMEALIDAVNKGQIYYYVNKPWEEKTLKILFDKAHEVYTLRTRNKELIAKMVELLNILDHRPNI